jgi:hypothetical protein
VTAEAVWWSITGLALAVEFLAMFWRARNRR